MPYFDSQDPTQDPNFGMIGTSQPQDPSVLAQALQSQSYPLPLTQQPSQQMSQEQDVSALIPHVDLTQQLQQMGHAERDLRRKEYLTHALGDFVFSLGQGLTAAAQTPRTGDANAAGAGAALQGPYQLQQMRLKQAQEQQRLNLQAQQAQLDRARMEQIQALTQPKADEMNAKTAAQRLVPLVGTDGKPKFDINGQPILVPASQQGVQFVKEQTADARQEEADKRLEILGKKTAADLRSMGIDPVTGEDIGESQMPPVARLKMQTLRLDQMLKDAQTDYERAKVLNLPEQMKLAQDRVNILKGNLAMRQKEYDANFMGTANGLPLPGAPTDENGTPIGARVFNLGAPARKAYLPALDADERLKIMLQNQKEGNENKSPQADLSLLANHVGMTLGLQKGARITQAYLQEAQHARPISGDLQVLWDKVSSGELLTPEQRQEMVNLALERRAEEWNKARRLASFSGNVGGEPAADPGLPAVPRAQQTSPAPTRVSPTPTTGPTPAAKAALAARMAQAKPGEVIEVSPGVKVRKNAQGNFDPVPR